MTATNSRAEAPPSRPRLSRLQYALNCAQRGWRVFPLYWADDGLCGCMNPKCTNVGKHPLTPHGVREATVDVTTIRAWWQECPDANIGVATGASSGIAVLDIDPQHGGDESLLGLEKKYGPLPDGPRVRTGGGGQHLYLAYSGDGIRNKVGLCPGIDVRGDGGYVVGAGSSHMSGKPYIWQHGKTPAKLPLPDMPEWLRTPVSSGQASQDSPGVDAIKDGHRNDTLASLGGTMRRRGMSRAAIEVALLQENQLRCKPPLDPAEVARIAASIGRYEPVDGNPSVSPKPIRPATILVFHNGAEIGTPSPRKSLGSWNLTSPWERLLTFRAK